MNNDLALKSNYHLVVTLGSEKLRKDRYFASHMVIMRLQEVKEAA